MASQYGCGRELTIEFPGGHAMAACGLYFRGELIQCEECQDSKPAPPVAAVDPNDADALAELEAERAFTPEREP